MQILLSPVIGTRATAIRDTVILKWYGAKGNKEYSLFTRKSVKVPRMGPGRATRDYFGRSVLLGGDWSKDPKYGTGALFKGTGK